MSYYFMGYLRQFTFLYLITSVLSQERCSDEEGEFLCPDGSCISREFVCDGSSDCIGGADETKDKCEFRLCSTAIEFSNRHDINIFAINEGRQFRCLYDACISQSFVCDGISNCRDGSDESDKQCRNNKCGPVEFRCDYGGCIPLSYVCNGVASCYDGSDETEALCKHRRCESRYKVQCAYGACIRKNQRCNGVANCVDESDESEELCGKGHKYRSYFQPIQTTLAPTIIRPELPPVANVQSTGSGGGCSAINPAGTSYELHKCGGISCDGDFVPTDTEITAVCEGDQYYDLVCDQSFRWVSLDSQSRESMSQICVTENLPTSNAPIQEEIGCSTKEFQSSFEVLRCGKSHLLSDCETRHVMPLGSILTQQCNPSETIIMSCTSNKKWHITSDSGKPGPIKACEVDISRLKNECGRTKRLTGEASGFLWPFLVGLFKNQDYICTGTLISYNIVLTSGHCLTRNKASSTDFLTPMELRIQHYKRGRIVYTPVSSIHIHPQYMGGNRPKFDVAIIRLTRFATSEDDFEPACLDTVGRIIRKPAVVFNRTEGDSNFSWTEFGQSMDLSCFNRNTPCSRHLSIDRNQYCGINSDSKKFLHAGSSGGPYLIRMDGSNEEDRWAVAGIVSHSVKTLKKSVGDVPCKKPHTVYASVFQLQQWITDCAFKSIC